MCVTTILFSNDKNSILTPHFIAIRAPGIQFKLRPREQYLRLCWLLWIKVVCVNINEQICERHFTEYSYIFCSRYTTIIYSITLRSSRITPHSNILTISHKIKQQRKLTEETVKYINFMTKCIILILRNLDNSKGHR